MWRAARPTREGRGYQREVFAAERADKIKITFTTQPKRGVAGARLGEGSHAVGVAAGAAAEPGATTGCASVRAGVAETVVVVEE